MRGNKEEKYVAPSCHSFLSNVGAKRAHTKSQGKIAGRRKCFMMEVLCVVMETFS